MFHGLALIKHFVEAVTYEVSRRLVAGEALEPAAVFGGTRARAGKGLGALRVVGLVLARALGRFRSVSDSDV